MPCHDLCGDAQVKPVRRIAYQLVDSLSISRGRVFKNLSLSAQRMHGAASAEQSRAMRRLNSSLSCLPNQNLSVFMYEKIFIFQEGILHRQTYYTLFGSRLLFSLSLLYLYVKLILSAVRRRYLPLLCCSREDQILIQRAAIHSVDGC